MVVSGEVCAAAATDYSVGNVQSKGSEINRQIERDCWNKQKKREPVL